MSSLVHFLKVQPLGCNGTFNNQDLPANDYWCAIALENRKTVKGNFALKK